MKKFLLISLLINASMFSQVMRKNSQFSLFSDNKAAMPGDAVTIIVIESTQASNSSQTSSGRTSDLGLSASGTVGTSSVPKTDISLGTKNDFKGSGTTSTNGMTRPSSPCPSAPAARSSAT